MLPKANHRGPTCLLPPTEAGPPGPDWAPSCGRFCIRFQGPAGRIGAPREESGLLRDVARGRRECPPGVFGPTWNKGPRGPKLTRKQPKPSQKSRNLRGNQQKSTSGQSGPSDHLGPPEKQGPQARSQAGAMGATAPSEGPIAPSGASLCTLCT